MDELLETIGEFGSASLALVAWDFWLSEEQLSPLWMKAARSGLIEPAGRCPETGEPIYSLTTSPDRTPYLPEGNPRASHRADDRSPPAR